MNVLIFGHRKTSTKIYDISTPEKELAAYLRVFKELDKFTVYCDLDEIKDLTVCPPCRAKLHNHCEKENCVCTKDKDCKDRARHVEREHHQAVVWKKWRDEAREGNGDSAKKLIKDRSARHYEYEEIEFDTVIDPLLEKVKA